jgi:LysR family transcriptional regulator, chromosome initiation inhibitor
LFEARQLQALIAVVEAGSFEAAARSLSITPSAVSQRVKSLEERAAQVLLVRASPCHATSAGEVLLRMARQVLHLHLAASSALPNALATADGAGSIAIAVNADSLATWWLPSIASWALAENCALDLQTEDQDHSTALLRSGRVLAAVTGEREAVQGCRVTKLGSMRYVAVASPVFAERYFSAGVSASSLSQAPCIVFNRKDDLQSRFLRQLLGTRAAAKLRPPTHWIASSHGFEMAARLSLGWGMVPQELVANHITNGVLVHVGSEAYLDVPLYWQCWRLNTPILTSLTRCVVTAARSHLL